MGPGTPTSACSFNQVLHETCRITSTYKNAMLMHLTEDIKIITTIPTRQLHIKSTTRK